MALLAHKIGINNLLDPAPEPDIDNIFDDNTAAKNENIDTGIAIELNPSRIRDIDLGDLYKGNVVSRDQLNNWNNSDNELDDIDNSDDNNLDNNFLQDDDNANDNDSDISIDDDSDDNDNSNNSSEEFDVLFEDKNEQTAGLPIGSLKPQKDKHSLDRFKDYNEFQSMMNKQMDAAQQLKKDNKLQLISSKHSQPLSFQLKKANAVNQQTKLYDKVASLRIHLQKTFLLAQRLPKPAIHKQIIDGNNSNNDARKKLKRLFNELSSKSLSITQNIMDLQTKLINKNDGYPARKKRKLNDDNDQSSNSNDNNDDLWNEMNLNWNNMIPFTNKILNTWDTKMRLTESHKVYKEKQKQIGNQSLLERIALIIDNPQRILNKMQSVDKLFRMYGDNIDDNNDIDIDNDGNDNDNNDGLSLKFEKYRIENEVFNDSQFYRRMLKEIIDIGHAATFNTQEIHTKMDQIQQERQKQKMAFHKAKLRMKYTIRPDMENFMAPRYNHDPDFPVQQLYNSLFQ